MSETGWNLLTFAAAMDDGPAVDELIAQDSRRRLSACLRRREMTWCVQGNSKKGTPLRREPMGQKLLEFAKDMTPMIRRDDVRLADVVEK